MDGAEAGEGEARRGEAYAVGHDDGADHAGAQVALLARGRKVGSRHDSVAVPQALRVYFAPSSCRGVSGVWSWRAPQEEVDVDPGRDRRAGGVLELVDAAVVWRMHVSKIFH